MVQKHYWLPNHLVRFLRKLPGTATEHVRSALEDYKIKWEKEHGLTSATSIKVEEGGQNGEEASESS